MFLHEDFCFNVDIGIFRKIPFFSIEIDNFQSIQSIMTKKRKLFYYAVRKGYNPGIYQSWEECKNQISGFPKNEYKGFSDLVEAEEYLKSPGGWSGGRGWNADSNLLERNSNQQFSEFAFTDEGKSLRKSTCGNGLLGDSILSKDLKDYYSSELKAEGCSDYLPLEPMFRIQEPSDQQRHDAKFSSFSEMCNILCAILACGVNLSEINKPAFLLHERVQSLKRHVSLTDDDDDTQLLDFASESHLYNYLGLESYKNSTAVMGERYFDSAYKLEFSATSEGNPGKSGAGIVLLRPDDSVVCKLMVGLGTMVKALADLHALILGLRASLGRGIYHIEVSGQFTLISGSKVHLTDRDATNLEKEADALINSFKFLLVKHKPNVCIIASTLAKKAVGLPDGCVRDNNVNK